MSNSSPLRQLLGLFVVLVGIDGAAMTLRAQSKPAAGAQAAKTEVPPPEQMMSPVDMAARLRILEKRLAEIEQRSGKRVSPKAAAIPSPPPAPASTKTDPAPVATTATDAAPPAPSKPAGTPPSTTVSEQEKTLAGSFIFRDNAPTLQANKLEIAIEGSYLRNSAFLQTDRLFQGSLSARYGLSNGFEVGATALYYASGRQTLANYQGADSVGDVQLQVSKQLWSPTDYYPGASASVGVILPTGRHPYKTLGNTTAGLPADPRDPLASLMSSRGHWATTGNLQFFKTFDPLIVFFGIGYDYALARTIEGFSIQPSPKLNFNAGFSFALSEHSTLGFQYAASIEGPLKIDKRDIAGLGLVSEAARARFLLVQRLQQDLYLEPSVTLGLTKDTPNVIVGATLRKRM